MTQLPGERIDGDVGVCFRTGFPKAATHTYTDFNKTYKPITREAGKMAFNGLATQMGAAPVSSTLPQKPAG